MKIRFLKTFFVAAGFWAALGISSLRAAEPMGQFEAEMSGKLTRGAVNILFGWTELLRSEEKIGDEHGAAAAVIWGPLDGIGNTVKRTAVGIYETATFPIKTSQNADPIIQPEFGALESDRAGYRPKDYKF